MSEALRMADAMTHYFDERGPDAEEVAAELRRLHAENETLKAELLEQARVNGMGGEREARLMTENAELVAALERIAGRCDAEPMYKIARAALAKIGETNV